MSRLDESDAMGFPKGRISCSLPLQTGELNEASLDRIQFKLPCKFIPPFSYVLSCHHFSFENDESSML
jgi:hypothetical protein